MRERPLVAIPVGMKLRRPYRSSASLLICLGATFSAAHAETCSTDTNTLDRGEQRPVLLCGADIPVNFRLGGLAHAGIRVNYAQHLRRCDFERSTPGLLLWLEADAKAVSAQLKVFDENRQPVCQPIDLHVPQRILLPAVDVAAPGPDNRIRQVRIATPLVSSWVPACTGKLGFPRDRRWPRLVAAGEPVCDSESLALAIESNGQQRFPAKIMVPLQARGGAAKAEGIAYLTPPEPGWAMDMTDADAKFIEVAGHRTRYFEAGSGSDALILVHGGQPDPISPNAQSWRPNFAALAKHFRVLALDSFGQGHNATPTVDQDYEEFYQRVAQHLAAFMDALNLHRVHLVGWSQGGWPIVRVALDQPDRVRCMVSIDSVMALGGAAGRSSGMRFAYLLFHVHPPQGPTIESILRLHEFEAATMHNISWSRALETYGNAQRPGLRQAQARLATLRMSPGHPAFRALRSAANAELHRGPQRVPHLIVWGSEDDLGPLEAGRAWFEAMPDEGLEVRFQLFDGAGHGPHIEFPDRFNELVTGFCGRYRADQ